MLTMPLFPLNTVLFPGMPLRLHIFEERYKIMIRECIEKSRPFGVVLIRHGVEALGPVAEPYTIGCTARIVRTEQLPEERINLVVLGQERFRLLSTDSESAPYLVGQVEPFPLKSLDPQAATELGERLLPLVKQYMHLLEGYLDRQYLPEDLPSEAASLAYMAAIILQVPPTVKQELLSIPETVDLLDSTYAIYRRELPLLKSVLLDGGSRKIGAFSEN